MAERERGNFILDQAGFVGVAGSYGEKSNAARLPAGRNKIKFAVRSPMMNPKQALIDKDANFLV